MGASVSQAGAPPPPPSTYASNPPPFAPAAADAAFATPPPKPHEEEATEEKVDYLNLPCPVPYEEIQREAFSESPVPPPFLLLCLICAVDRHRDRLDRQSSRWRVTMWSSSRLLQWR